MWLKKYILRAGKDTKGFFEPSWKKTALPVALLCLGVFLHSRWTVNPVDPLMQIITWVTYTAAPLGLFVVVLFLWNLVRAPFRINNERISEFNMLFGSSSDKELLSLNDNYSISTIIGMIAGDSASQFAKDALHEKISDYLTEIHNQNIKDTLSKDDGKWYLFFGIRSKSNLFPLNKRVSKSTLISFAKECNITLPDGIKNETTNIT